MSPGPALQRAGLFFLCLCLGACAGTGSRVPDSTVASGRFCDRAQTFTASQQDQVLSFAAILRDTLDATGARLALISRSGLDLSRLGVRYSHTGISVKHDAPDGWLVRQLYYACEEGRPRIYDQGLSGFLFGTDRPTGARISIVLLPAEPAEKLRLAALNNTLALQLLASTYSANSFPFSTRYQNCNQWVIEMIAAAFGELHIDEDLREHAQAWLADNAYQPRPVELSSYLLKLAVSLSPMVHLDDHPQATNSGLLFQLSLPRGIERFVHEQLPEAHRIELCHHEDRVVIRDGWQALDAECTAGFDDRVVMLN